MMNAATKVVNTIPEAYPLTAVFDIEQIMQNPLIKDSQDNPTIDSTLNSNLQ